MGCRQDAHPIPNGPPAGYVSFHQSLIVKCMSGKKKLHLGENHIAIFENPTYHCITVTAISLIYLWHVGGPRCGVYMSNYIVIYIYIHVYNYNIMVIYTYIYIYIHICDLFLYVYLPSN